MPEREYELSLGKSAPALDSALPLPVAAEPASTSLAGDGAEDDVLIEYRPYIGIEKWLKYRFSAWSQSKAWFVMTLVVSFFALGGPGWILRRILDWATRGAAGGAASTAAILVTSQQVIYLVFFFVAALFGAAALRYMSAPTHVGLGRHGLRFHWLRDVSHRAGPLVPWSRLTHVYLVRPAGKTSPQDYSVAFRVGDRTALSLKLGSIPTQKERARLLEAMNEFAPAVTRDAELMDVLSPPQDHSYTELWLQALSAPPKRERLTPLSEGGHLRDSRYRVIEQLGVGGQGTAYLAADTAQAGEGSGELVVLKETILPVYVDVNVRRQALERFQNEAAMLRRLDHPQIVKLVDFFVEDHRSYLVLEHIDGLSLRQLVERDGPLGEARARELAVQMCDILQYLHELSPPVVHRDFTPDNLILRSDGTLKLVDFNVAQQSESTATGTVVGKHAYLPPEQFRGRPVTQSDIYALGATLFYLVVGQDPEPISTSHPLLARDDLSAEFDALVARATDIDCRRRYLNVGEIKGDLSAGEAGTSFQFGRLSS